MTIKEAAKKLAINEQLLRELIKANTYEWADCINLSGRRFKYIIYDEKFNHWLQK